MKLHFFEWNSQRSARSSDAIPFIFLHGMGGIAQMWRPIAASLEDEFSCFAFDQRGHGQSRPVPPDQAGFHAEDYGRDVVETLKSLGLGQVILVGHSMGVRTALSAAHLAPEVVKGLIAVDIGISSEWGGGMGKPLAHFLEKLPESFSDRSRLKEYLLRECPDSSIAQYLSAVAKKTSLEPETWTFPFDHSALVQTIEEANEAPLGDWVKEIASHGTPLLFLRGENSKVWLKKDYEAQKKQYAHPLLQFEEWEKCGHGLPFEQRTRFIQALREFQARLK